MNILETSRLLLRHLEMHDLDTLTAELARVVGETMPPERTGVWLTGDRKI